MGGPGSGNHLRSGTRGACEDQKRIDIRYMRKHGMLKPGSAGTPSWNRGDEPTGWIRYRTHPASLELDYRYREGGGEWESVNEHIRFSETPQHFGGTRKWVVCPSCLRDCAVLCGAGVHFRCRKCYSLGYATQNENAHQRLFTRLDKIKRRLGGQPGDDWIPEKPKGMHWRTYNRLAAKAEALYYQCAQALADWMARL